MSLTLSISLLCVRVHINTNMHKHIHIYTPTPTTGVLRARIPECGDAWKFSVVGDELATATLGVLKVTPSSSSCNLQCIVTSSPNLQFYFVNCFSFIFAVPWRIKCPCWERNWLGRVVFWRSWLSDGRSDPLQ